MFSPYSSKMYYYFLKPLSPYRQCHHWRRLEAKEYDTTKPEYLAQSPPSHSWSSTSIHCWRSSRQIWKPAQHTHCDCAEAFWIKACDAHLLQCTGSFGAYKAETDETSSSPTPFPEQRFDLSLCKAAQTSYKIISVHKETELSWGNLAPLV